jgi:hypothetical protein
MRWAYISRPEEEDLAALARRALDAVSFFCRNHIVKNFVVLGLVLLEAML